MLIKIGYLGQGQIKNTRYPVQGIMQLNGEAERAAVSLDNLSFNQEEPKFESCSKSHILDKSACSEVMREHKDRRPELLIPQFQHFPPIPAAVKCC
jgi:hypothetical protein